MAINMKTNQYYNTLIMRGYSSEEAQDILNIARQRKMRHYTRKACKIALCGFLALFMAIAFYTAV